MSNLVTVASVVTLVVRYLRSGHPKVLPHRVRLPLIRSGAAKPGEELTPEQVKDLLLEQEVEWYLESIGAKHLGSDDTGDRS